MSEAEMKPMSVQPNGTLIVHMGDQTYMQCSLEHIRECLNFKEEGQLKIEELERALSYLKPSDFAPRMIAELEWRAAECDKMKWFAQAMAYRDAAGIMRKALGEEKR